MKSVLLFFLISYNLSAGEKFVLFMGGGGDDPKERPSTIFDQELFRAAAYLNSPYLKKENVDIVFNGGHPNTERDLKFHFPNKEIKPLSRKSYSETIDKYKNLINSGKIKSGDSLMIMIDSHGAPAVSGSLAHQVATGKHGSNQQIDLAELKEVVKLANAKGIKLAIADLGCYSGNTQQLANDKTCVISSTGPDVLSYKGDKAFSYYLLNNLRSGDNLEDSFLKARNTCTDRSYPMISSTKNLSVFNLTYNAIKPYLSFKEDDGSTPGYIDDNWLRDNSEALYCQNVKNYNSFLKMINVFEADQESMSQIVSKIFFEERSKYWGLKKLLQQAYNEYRKYAGEYLVYKKKLSKKITFKYRNSKNELREINYTVEQILFSNFQDLLSKELKGANDQGLVNLYNAIISQQTNLKKKYPGLVTIEKRLREIGKKIKETESLSIKISNEERKLYSDLYNQYVLKSEKSNPCRDFKL